MRQIVTANLRASPAIRQQCLKVPPNHQRKICWPRGMPRLMEHKMGILIFLISISKMARIQMHKAVTWIHRTVYKVMGPIQHNWHRSWVLIINLLLHSNRLCIHNQILPIQCRVLNNIAKNVRALILANRIKRGQAKCWLKVMQHCHHHRPTKPAKKEAASNKMGYSI